MIVNSGLLASGIVAVAVGGLAFAVLGGESRAENRRRAIGKSDKIERAAMVDRAAKKKQIAESLLDLEKKSKRKRVDFQTRIEQAGLSIKRDRFLLIFVAIGLVLGMLVYLKSGSFLLAFLAATTIIVGMPNFVISRLRARRIKKFVDVLPSALDIIVRGVRAGLPLGDTLRIIANEAQEPVRSEFRKVVESQALGISTSEAVAKLAQRVPTTESNFFAIVIEIQSKAGGNLAEAIGNVSKTVRERKKMKGKIGAMSMEALASAAIIGAVPFVVVGALYAVSPDYIGLLFTTNHGRLISVIALGWMSIGAMMMKKMINFDF
jgi:tight adherence protein B